MLEFVLENISFIEDQNIYLVVGCGKESIINHFGDRYHHIEQKQQLGTGHAVMQAAEMLEKGGRMCIITFHSLEDRLVKQTINDLSKGCTCPPSFPVCVCGKKPTVKQITRKPILPSDKELEENKRSHSAKLRVAEKL